MKKDKKKLVTQARLKKKFIGKQKEILISAFFCICMVLLLVIGIMKIRMHRIDGSSMEPTLTNSDRLIIWKTKIPDRYDLIAFDPENTEDSSYTKRVVGIPGDRIWVEGNALFINCRIKKEQAEKDIPAKELPDGTLKVTITENVWNDLEHLDNIPDGCYFVLGDNSNHSTDSRHFGFVRDDQVEGVAVIRYYPFSKMGIIN
ncbi:signal peptidase I [Enterococcus sp. BWB1-3]|uniref:signal peptidase I n=1 Tax=Enterococcus sp. BWB1-3 TaxID=2787713 RepID=UPI001921F84F|nr:signal peptidase I [Enterococcus sp. BWB1-3]MBL1229467.1 signal peptidase I [Enterococcus sp. BWB1-3]